MTKDEELLYLSSLKLYSDEIYYLVKKFYSPKEALEDASLDPEIKIEKRIMKKYRQNKDDFASYRDFMEKNRISYITYYNDGYPEALKEIDTPPMVLYYKGSFNLKGPSISVVGSRKCTDYGKWACKKIVAGLAPYGVNIISGLALGIDKTSHQAALDGGLYTMGVLGCGVDRIYPLSNKTTFERMEEEGSCIVSEFALGSLPRAHHFPIRNRIISGISSATLVIEAKERSGTLITAGLAADQGRDVFAVPGNINSQFSKGTNALIRDGAKLVTSAEDIVEEFPELEEIRKVREEIERDLKELKPVEKEIYECLAGGPKATDYLARVLKIKTATLLSNLTMMELKGFLVELDGAWQLNE